MKIVMTYRVPGSQISQTVALRTRRQSQEGESGEWSRASRSFDEFEEYADVDPLRRSLQSVRMSRQGSIRAARKNAQILMIRVRRGQLIQGETHCESQTLGCQCPIRETSATHSDPQRLQFAALLCGRGTIHRPRKRHPLQAETRDQCNRALNGISMLQEVPRSGISAVQRKDEWVLLEVTVDSGACVTVMPSGLCPGISIIDNDLSKNGVEYEVANGESIGNMCERRCQVMTVGSMAPKRIVLQVADVHKPLLSITPCSDMGYDCYLGKEGSSLRDRVTGEVIPLERRGSLYSLRMWVRQDPGINSNSSFAWPE